MTPQLNNALYVVDRQEEDIDIDDLKYHNIRFQATSHQLVCYEQPTHPYLRLVYSNTVDAWITYFSIDNNIYSKGMERLYLWQTLFNYRRLLLLSSDVRYFVLSSLIILLQIYGNGNHRTASYLYNKHTGRILNLSLISNLYTNYSYSISNLNSIYNLIEQLIILSSSA